MPFADRCHLKIPFPSWARDNKSQPERDFENWKELQRWADDFYATCLPAASAGGVPTVFVAAYNASDKSKGLADFLCDGTDDDVEIQAAVASLPGQGRVVLSEGLYYAAASVTLGGGVHLMGMGVTATSLDVWGAPAVITAADSSVSGITFYSEIPIRLNGNDAQVRNCVFNGAVTGIDGAALRGAIEGCRFESCSTYAIDARNTAELTVRDCWFLLNGTAIHINEEEVMVRDCRFKSNTLAVNIAATANNTVLTGNWMSNGAVDVTDAALNTQYGTNFSLMGAW